MEPPVVDLAGRDVVRQVGAACERWGFFQVVNHGADADVVRAFDLAMERFFQLPRESKLRVKRRADNPRGWFDDELTKRRPDHKEGFDMGAEGRFEVDGENQWPDQPAAFREHVLAYYAQVEDVALRVTRILAEALGLPADAFDADVVENTSFMRLNYYPVCADAVKAAPEDFPADQDPDPEVEGSFCINRHTDAGVVTVLRQRDGDPPSLQVLDRQAGKFVRIHPAPGAFIINVGDVLQVWSNDRFQSPVHRVLAHPERVRFSSPYFLNPRYASACVPRTLAPGEVSHYKRFSWGEFRRRRFEGDFEDTGYDEVQISDYRDRDVRSRM